MRATVHLWLKKLVTNGHTYTVRSVFKGFFDYSSTTKSTLNVLLLLSVFTRVFGRKKVQAWCEGYSACISKQISVNQSQTPEFNFVKSNIGQVFISLVKS